MLLSIVLPAYNEEQNIPNTAKVLAGLLEEKPKELEVVMTGRNPPEQLIHMAEYVSEIHKRKHPFDVGIGAREGIEY